MLLAAAVVHVKTLVAGSGGFLRLQAAYFLQYGERRGNVYNILWALVFGFATLNILGLVARRFDPDRNRLSFGELLAVTVVIASVLLLGWEMLYLFHILPIKLQPQY
jgi:hypothetical protein